MPWNVVIRLICEIEMPRNSIFFLKNHEIKMPWKFLALSNDFFLTKFIFLFVTWTIAHIRPWFTMMKEAQAHFIFPYCFQKCEKRVQKLENYLPSWGAPSSALTVFQFLSLILMAFLVVLIYGGKSRMITFLFF